MAETLTMPRTAADLQPDRLVAFYGEALEARSFDDPVTGSPMFAQMRDVRYILSHPDEFGNEFPGRPDIPGTLAPRFALGPNALPRAIEVIGKIPRTTAGGDGREHEAGRTVTDGIIPTSYRKAHEQLGRNIRERVAETVGRGLLPQLVGYSPTGDVVDVMHGVRELPLMFIADYLGYPKDPEVRRALIEDGADQIMLLGSQMPEDRQLRSIDGFEDLWHKSLALVDSSSPGDSNFTTRALAHTRNGHPDGEPTLSPLEVAGTDINLVVAGHSTLTDSLTNAMRWMAEHPADWDRALRNPDSMPEVSRELLRLCGGIWAWWRVALKDVVIADREIKAGTPVGVILGAANRDPRHFGYEPDQDPNKLIPNRRVKSDVVFGSGVPGHDQRKSHFCVGAGIAQVVMTEFFGALAKKYPNFQLAHPNPSLKHNVIFLEHESLQTILEPTGS